jgi:copper chaperone CopZ
MHATAMLTAPTTDEVDPILCQKFHILGMTCGHCEEAVRAEVRKVDGVAAVRASAYSGTVTIETDREVAFESVVRAVNEAGYQVVRQTAPDDPSPTATTEVDR